MTKSLTFEISISGLNSGITDIYIIYVHVVSGLWQKQHTTEQLNQVFKAIIDAGANWAVLNNFEPVLPAESKVSQDGVLVLSGYYPTKPSQIHFEQKYIYEGISWKLLGFKIEFKWQ